MYVQTMPRVEMLAQKLAAGLSPVDLHELYTAGILQVEPAPTADQLAAFKLELRARLLFAWELARAESIRNRRKEV